MEARNKSFCKNISEAITYFHSKDIPIEDITEKTAQDFKDSMNYLNSFSKIREKVTQELLLRAVVKYHSRFILAEEAKIKQKIDCLATLTLEYAQGLADFDYISQDHNFYHLLAEIKREETGSIPLRQQAV